jgi:hypothetical protein
LAGIAVPVLGLEVATDANGWFLLSGLPVGIHVVRVSADGGSETAALRVSADDRNRVELFRSRRAPR